MMNCEKYDGTLDFTQRFQIGRGAGIEATMDHANEVTVYLYRDMDNMSSHLCHIYDRELHRMTSGSRWQWQFLTINDPLQADIWEDW